MAVRDDPADPLVGHQARLLLMIDALTDHAGGVRALSAIASYDFLLRYPIVLERVAADAGSELPIDLSVRDVERVAIEARMLRYKFGFWDHRYYSLIGRLVSTELVELEGMEAPLELRTSDRGREAAAHLAGYQWELLHGRARFIASRLHGTGYQLRQAIEKAVVAA